MTETFGGQTAYFITVTDDLDDLDRYGKPAKARTEVAVPGCRFRPLDTSEAIDLGDVTLKKWKLTAPPAAAVLAAKATGEVRVDGVTFQIVGDIRPFTDMEGDLFKVTVICEKREG